MGIDNRDNNINGEHVIQLISAYIDNALDARDQERVRAHLATCEVCGAELREIQATQRMLRALPVQVPPRVFTLTEEMVGARPPTEARPSLLSRLFGKATAPRLATGSVLAFALLLVVLVSDLGLVGRSAPSMPTGFSYPGGAAAPIAAADPTYTTAAAGEQRALADQTAMAETGGATGAGGGVEADEAPTEVAAGRAAEGAAAPTATGADAAGDTQAATAPAPPSVVPDERAVAGVAEGTSSPGTDVAAFSVRSPTAQATEQMQVGDEAPLAALSDSGGNSFPVTLAIEVGLALLGIGLAIGAILARRRSA